MVPLPDIYAANPHWEHKSTVVPHFRRDLFHQIWKDIDINLMSFITGQRRVGKSIILKQILADLIEAKKVNPRQILFFEFSPNFTPEDIVTIFDHFKRHVANENQRMYLLLDEIQFVKKYEIPIKLMYDRHDASDNLKIIITGSLSLSYKRRMAESLAGRFLSYKLYPLNFYEYLRLVQSPLAEDFLSAQSEPDKLIKKGRVDSLNPAFRTFLELGRLPQTALNPDRNLAIQYLSGIVFQSLSQDALSYFNVELTQIMIAVYEHIRDNSGGELSIENISQTIGADRRTISNYIDILEIMGLVYLVSNSSQPLIKINARKKAYVNSMFYLLSSKRDLSTSLGFAAESYVLEQLLERREMVTFFRYRNQETDFLLPKQKLAYEVKFTSDEIAATLPTKLKDYQLQVISHSGEIPVCLF